MVERMKDVWEPVSTTLNRERREYMRGIATILVICCVIATIIGIPLLALGIVLCALGFYKWSELK
jgi:hypothetical protein